MSDDFTPRIVRVAHLIGALVIFLLLVLSAILVGRLALNFITDAVAAVANAPRPDVIFNIIDLFVKNMVVDFGTGLETGRTVGTIRSAFAVGSGMVAVALFFLVYPIIWLRFARLCFRWLQSGAWAFHDGLEPDNIPGPLPDQSEIRAAFESKDLPIFERSRSDSALLGKNLRYTPNVFQVLVARISSPFRVMRSMVMRTVFWFALATAISVGLMAFASASDGVLIGNTTKVIADPLQRHFGAVGIWLVVAVVLGSVFAIMDWAFARALVPADKPANEKIKESVRDLSVMSPPAQFDQVFRSELEIKLRDVTCFSSGVDNTRESFADQSSFFLNLMVEGTSERLENYAEAAAKKRVILATLMLLVGVAILLLGLMPANLLGVLGGERLSLAAALISPLWLITALTVGNNTVRRALIAIEDSTVVLNAGWFKTPLVLMRFDGVVNTQMTATGKTQDYAAESELRYQESKFDVAVMSATVMSDAPTLDAPRSIWSFAPDAASYHLDEAVRTLLREEGSQSAIQAAHRAIRHTEEVRVATERQRIESQIQEIEQKKCKLEALIAQAEHAPHDGKDV